MGGCLGVLRFKGSKVQGFNVRLWMVEWLGCYIVELLNC